MCIYIHTHTYIYTHTHTHTHNGILLTHKNNEILLFATTWISLEGIMLNIGWYQLHLESKNKLVNLTKKEQTFGEQTTGYQWGKVGESGKTGVWD